MLADFWSFLNIKKKNPRFCIGPICLPQQACQMNETGVTLFFLRKSKLWSENTSPKYEIHRGSQTPLEQTQGCYGWIFCSSERSFVLKLVRLFKFHLFTFFKYSLIFIQRISAHCSVKELSRISWFCRFNEQWGPDLFQVLEDLTDLDSPGLPAVLLIMNLQGFMLSFLSPSVKKQLFY